MLKLEKLQESLITEEQIQNEKAQSDSILSIIETLLLNTITKLPVRSLQSNWPHSGHYHETQYRHY